MDEALRRDIHSAFGIEHSAFNYLNRADTSH
jgi:hypothetical protein